MRNRKNTGIPAILALVAVGMYAICCKPAWSPKGDEIAYICGYETDGKETWAVAVYDLASKQSRVIKEWRGDEEPDFVPIEVFWPERGNELVWVSAPRDAKKEGGAVQVSTYDLRRGAVTDFPKVAVPKVNLGSSLAPMILRGKRWLWIYGDDAYHRVDLRRGEAVQLEKAKLLLRKGDDVFYVGGNSEDVIEFGRIRTLFGLRERPLFSLVEKEGEDLFPIAAMPVQGTRFAVIVRSQETKRLRVYDEAGRRLAEIPLPTQIDFEDDMLIGAEWSPDGTVLWVTAEVENEAGVSCNGIVEIHLAERSVRTIKINEGQHGDLAPLHISRSPSGSHLAVSTLRSEKPGLCIVDLTSDARTVTLVPPPEASTPPPPSETG